MAIYKALLEHGHAPSFAHRLCCFGAVSAELSSCNRDHMASETRNTTNWFFNKNRNCRALTQVISSLAPRLPSICFSISLREFLSLPGLLRWDSPSRWLINNRDVLVRAVDSTDVLSYKQPSSSYNPTKQKG